MTSEEPTGETPDTTAKSDETNETEEGTVKKKRRRRGKRGGRGRNKPKAESASTDENAQVGDEDKPERADDSERSSSEGSSEDAGPKKRRRGTRGGGGGGRKSDGDRKPPRARTDDADDDYDPMEDQPKVATKRVTPDIAPEDWEDIYDQQTFADLGLRNSLLKSLDEAGYKHPTKIQAELVPLVLGGKDVLGQSRTGTGKTAAFGLPLYNQATRGVPQTQCSLAAPAKPVLFRRSSVAWL